MNKCNQQRIQLFIKDFVNPPPTGDHNFFLFWSLHVQFMVEEQKTVDVNNFNQNTCIKTVYIANDLK